MRNRKEGIMPATMSSKTTRTSAKKNNTVTVKKAAPSKPGEKVDTTKAPVVGVIPAEVAEKMEQDGKAKTAAIKAGKLTKQERSAGNGSGPHARLTMKWTGKGGKDVAVKDKVKTAEGIVIDVIGRWTKKTAKGNVPMVTGHIASNPPEGKKVGDRQNAVATGCTHVK
jgi:hypothetical protein